MNLRGSVSEYSLQHENTYQNEVHLEIVVLVRLSTWQTSQLVIFAFSCAFGNGFPLPRRNAEKRRVPVKDTPEFPVVA